MNIKSFVLCLSLILLLTLQVAHAQTEPILLGSIVKKDITPIEPVTLAGYANRKDLSQGIHDSLSLRVVAFECGAQSLVLVSTDIIGYYNGTADSIRNAIFEKFGLKPSELFLTAIHTHAAPNISLDESKGNPSNVMYTKFLKETLLKAIGQALSNLKPVRLGIGSGSSPVGVNRREVFYDEAGNPRTWIGRNPDGVQDREVQVVKIVQGDKLIGVLFNYACHSTSLGWDNYLISGDLHGLAEQFVEEFYKKGVIAPAFAGASGDIDPWYRVLPGFETKNGWIPESVLMGTMLGEEVIHVARTINVLDVGGEIDSAYVSLDLPGKPRGEWQSKIDHPKTSLNITVARIGSIAFVGIGGEIFSEIGMAIKAASPFSHTIIITHCNGTAGYMAPQHRYVEQGYEIQSAPFASTAAEMVIKQVLKMLHQLE